jgi:hypothetical protein
VTPFRLELVVQGTRLIVDVIGNRSTPVRLYTRACAWGCASYTLHLVLPDGSAMTLREPQRVWTRHGPVTVLLARGQSHREVFEAGQPGWEGWQALAPLRDAPLRLHMALHSADTPPATEHGVTAGTAISPERLSPPPHAWLLPG